MARRKDEFDQFSLPIEESAIYSLEENVGDGGVVEGTDEAHSRLESRVDGSEKSETLLLRESSDGLRSVLSKGTSERGESSSGSGSSQVHGDAAKEKETKSVFTPLLPRQRLVHSPENFINDVDVEVLELSVSGRCNVRSSLNDGSRLTGHGRISTHSRV